ncbi:unnamed protein product, partial [Prunus brigantina]
FDCFVCVRSISRLGKLGREIFPDSWYVTPCGMWIWCLCYKLSRFMTLSMCYVVLLSRYHYFFQLGG